MVNRRERVRAATVQEIKDVARRQLVGDGPSAVSLRAIAREMGMTAPALYRYFPSFDHLVQSLVSDLSTELCSAVEAARELAPTDDASARLLAVCRAFRSWSVTHPAEFGLIFGTPTPGQRAYTPERIDTSASATGPSSTPNGSNGASRPLVANGMNGTNAHDLVRPGTPNGTRTRGGPPGRTHDTTEEGGGARFGRMFLSSFADVWQERQFATPDADDLPERLTDQLEEYRQRLGSTLPLGALAVVFACWMRLYGLVSLEVFNHMSFALSDPEPFFEGELNEIARRLGITTVGHRTD
jgi:AcrR family transcriptional regulator